MSSVVTLGGITLVSLSLAAFVLAAITRFSGDPALAGDLAGGAGITLLLGVVFVVFGYVLYRLEGDLDDPEERNGQDE